MKQIAAEAAGSPESHRWQPIAGLICFTIALISPLLAPLVLASRLPEDMRLSLAGLLLFGLPMALMLAVVAMLGKPAYEFLNRRAAGDPAAPPVSVSRYRIGLVILVLAMLVSWIEPLVSPRVAAVQERRVLIGALSDAFVLVALFVLGGDFWDKFRALFVHDARVLPDPATAGLLPAADAIQVGWRFYAGIAVLACGFGSWALVPIASAAGWSAKEIATLTGAIFIGSKVGLIAAIAIMGKAGFNYTKQIVFGFLSRFAPAREVSAGRYRLGLVLFLIPFLMTWLGPFASGLVRPIGLFGFLQSLALEVLVLVGLFLLGGEFWDKVRALFRHRARVDIPRPAAG